MAGIALEVALQRAFALSNSQAIVRTGKVIHANMHIASGGEHLNGGAQNRQLLFATRQVIDINAPLRGKTLGHMRVIKHRKARRVELDHLA